MKELYMQLMCIKNNIYTIPLYNSMHKILIHGIIDSFHIDGQIILCTWFEQ